MLPNGMIGSINLGLWRESDSGLLNMSGLDQYLQSLFESGNDCLPFANMQYPSLYADGVFSQLLNLVARSCGTSQYDSYLDTEMASVPQSIEHIFAFHYNLFDLFAQPQRFRLLLKGNNAHMLIVNSFLFKEWLSMF